MRTLGVSVAEAWSHAWDLACSCCNRCLTLFAPQLEASNPMLKTMLDSNPAMRAMMQNPAFLSQMLNPDVMQVCVSLCACMCAFTHVWCVAIHRTSCTPFSVVPICCGW